jgi:hypothetical protein
MTEDEHPEVETPDAPDAIDVDEVVGGRELPEKGDAVRTGVADVDAVLEAVEDLADRPLEEHVAVFEDAHGRLRRALDDPGTPGT